MLWWQWRCSDTYDRHTRAEVVVPMDSQACMTHKFEQLQQHTRVYYYCHSRSGVYKCVHAAVATDCRVRLAADACVLPRLQLVRCAQQHTRACSCDCYEKSDASMSADACVRS